MVIRSLHRAVWMAAVLALGLLPGNELRAEEKIATPAAAPAPAPGPLYYNNYYVAPGPGGQVGAQLYPSPRPTPPIVGGTYITYQALQPHEFLYQHSRTYIRPYPDGTATGTTVRWAHRHFMW